MKKNNKKGFTLAELLIVVAIIAVLVAIAIPVFTAQLEKSRDATTIANVRSAYAEAMAKYMSGDSVGADSVDVAISSVIFQTAQANSWSGQAANLPFTGLSDPGDITKATGKTVTFTFKTDDNAETTCEVKSVS